MNNILLASEVEPSKKFLDALNEFKQRWTDARIFTEPEEFEMRYNDLVALGKKEGILACSILDRFHERRMNRHVCNQEITISRYLPLRDRLCDTCKDKKERQGWKEWQDKVRREEYPVEDEMEHGRSCSCELCSQVGSVRCRLCDHINGYRSMYDKIVNEDLDNLFCRWCTYNMNELSEVEIERGV